MTVAFDAATENLRTGTGSPTTFSHAGAASNVKGVLLAIMHGDSTTDHVSAASYGGVAMTRVLRVAATGAEPGASEVWFLGSSVPQGTQTVSYTSGTTTDDIHVVIATLTGAADLEVIDSETDGANTQDVNSTLSYAGRTAIAFAAMYSGANIPENVTPNAGTELVFSEDLGAFSSFLFRQTTPGSSDFNIGVDVASLSLAWCALAISEVQSGEVTKSPTQAVLTLSGLAPSTNPFNHVRIKDVLINASGQPVANATDIRLMIWYSGECIGAPDLSMNGQTTNADGSASWSFATGALTFGSAIFYVAQNSVSFSTYTCARMVPDYSLG